jgi:hypothetical protein
MPMAEASRYFLKNMIFSTYFWNPKRFKDST